MLLDKPYTEKRWTQTSQRKHLVSKITKKGAAAYSLQNDFMSARLGQDCTTFSLLSAAFCLFLWITTASELEIFLFFALLLFSHPGPSLLPHVCLAVFPSRLSSCSRQRTITNPRTP